MLTAINLIPNLRAPTLEVKLQATYDSRNIEKDDASEAAQALIDHAIKNQDVADDPPNGPNRPLRYSGAYALALLGKKYTSIVVPVLTNNFNLSLARLKENPKDFKSIYTCYAIALAVREIGKEASETIPILQTAMTKCAVQPVRYMSASALGYIDEIGESKNDLVNALNDKDCNVALEAAYAIIRIDSSLANNVIEVLSKRIDASRFGGTLEKIISFNGDNFLIEQLGNEDKITSHAAEFALLERLRRKSPNTVETANGDLGGLPPSS
ncbi:MAG: hypothetical protein HYY52_00400 [Candidatus Melainabacteria bacterium]|nr:hypothetical protein [Candidatus Melainabacteria bacterium]